MKASYDHLYHHARRAFTERYGAGEASAMAFALLEDQYGASRTDVLLGKDTEFSAEEHHKFEKIVKKIADGVPLQHAVGRALYCGRYFKVTPDTLIPRPETEKAPLLLPPIGGEFEVSDGGLRGLPVARENGAGRRVLDCGTGSGCIAITIALEHPDWEVEAWDISEGALAVARENAEALGAKNVKFLKRDILAEAEKVILAEAETDILADPATHHQAASSAEGKYWAIISNPPYICRREAADMEAHVLDHEPHTALFVPDDDPLLFYRALAVIARSRLLPGGHLIVECNRAYTQETAALFQDHGLNDIEIIDDCFGAPRFVRGKKVCKVGVANIL